MRTFLALGVVALGLAAAGSAMASDDRDGGRDESRKIERTSGDDGDAKQAGRRSERDRKDDGARHDEDGDDKSERHDREHNSKHRDGRRS